MKNDTSETPATSGKHWLMHTTQQRSQPPKRGHSEKSLNRRIQYASSRPNAAKWNATLQPEVGGVSSVALDGARARSIRERLDLRTGVGDSRANTPTLLFFLLTRLPRQFPLLSCLMIVRLCHDVLLC